MKIEVVPCEGFPCDTKALLKAVRIRAQWEQNGITQMVESCVIDSDEHPMHVANVLCSMSQAIFRHYEKHSK